MLISNIEIKPNQLFNKEHNSTIHPYNIKDFRNKPDNGNTELSKMIKSDSINDKWGVTTNIQNLLIGYSHNNKNLQSQYNNEINEYKKESNVKYIIHDIIKARNK